ncbi:hypothetical protein [Nocardia sp. NBC_01327]|uniref:hypothetical protein n=1 Tax=Nocardia sp. NBC_01327 TaxID=2903593 RepID=UPI002E1446D5|nr:hypothetical protein OG326_18775 [Nocardia sp. NBC_01327]
MAEITTGTILMRKHMNIRLASYTAAVLTASVVGTATAVADPGTTAPAVSYHATLDNTSVVATLDNGVFALADDQRSVTVRDISGQVLDALPLALTLDGQGLPLHSQITDAGRTLRLTPDLGGLDRSALKPVAAPLENQLAMNDLINAVSIGTSLGSLVGTAIGAVIGVGVGVVLAGASCVVLSLGCVVAVLPIMALVGGVGGLAGLVVAGGPVAAAALFDYVTTLNTAPGHSRYAPNLQGKPGIPDAAATDAPN